jgi:serine/threonine protein kinase
MNEKGTLHVDQIDRMLREAKTWNKLDDHDHIVDVVDYDSDPLPWIAMEYMNGGHLGDRTGEMELQQALWTAITVTKGVRHAHRKGVAHLDLKPANILFRTIEDGWDVPKVADWGLSKHLLNHSNSIEGLSPQYASPEEFDSEYGSTDDITDIYQLGVVFYELFTGRPPFEGTPAKTMHKVLQQEPTPPSEIADVPAELDDILLTALAKQKDDRYEDILHLRDDLKSLFDSVTGELNRATTRSDSANEQNTGYKHSNESTVGESNISNNADTASTTHKQTSLSSNNKPIDTPTASTTDESAVNTESQTNADLSELLDEITSESQASETSQLRDEAFLKISDFTDGSLSLRDFTGNMLDIEELSEGTINNDHISVLDIQDFVGDIPVRGSSQENTPN